MTERNRPDRDNRPGDRARREWRGRGGLESYYEANRFYNNRDQWPRDEMEEDWDDEPDNVVPEHDEEGAPARRRQWLRPGEQPGRFVRPPGRGGGPQYTGRPDRYGEQGRAYRYQGEPARGQRTQPGYSSFDDDADFGYHVDPRTRHSQRDQHWSEYEGYDQAYGNAGMRSDYGMDYKNENDFGYDQGPWAPGQEFTGRVARGPERYARGGRRGAEDYTGMGPASYHRQDARIEEEINERLTVHSRIDARNVEVAVQEGEVTLRGSVPNREMKRLAEDIAAYVSGVRDVQNNLRVSMPDRGSRGQAQGFQDPQPEKRRAVDQRREDEPSAPVQTTLESSLSSEARTQHHEEPLNLETRRKQLRQQMQVIGRDGKEIGRVKEIRDRDILVQRDFARDIYVPYAAVVSVGETAVLNIDAGTSNDQGWENPA